MADDIPEEEEKVTWPEVCGNVGFSDGLYRTCREKVNGFNGFQGGAYDDYGDEEEDVDFSEKISAGAQKIPSPPPADWQPEQGLFGALMGGTTGRLLMYGGGAALLWWFLVKPKQQVAVTETPAAPVTQNETSPKAA